MKRALLLAIGLLSLSLPAQAATTPTVELTRYSTSGTTAVLGFSFKSDLLIDQLRLTIDPTVVTTRSGLNEDSAPAGPARYFQVTNQNSVDLTLTTSALTILGAHRARAELLSAGKSVATTDFFLSSLTSARRTPVTLIWPITDRPHRGLDNVFLDDQLATDIGANGRLTQLVRLGAGNNVVWALDPELVAAVEQMSFGYQVRRGEQLVDGQGADAARVWLDALKSATAGRDVIALPYADPDIASISASNAADLSDYGARTLERVLGRSTFSMAANVAWPSDGKVSKTALSRGVIISTSRNFTSDATATPAAVGPKLATTRVLVADAVIGDALAQGSVTGINRALAELATITAERPADQRIQLLVPPRIWNPSNDAALSLLASVRTDLRGLNHLLNQQPGVWQIPATDAKPFSKTYVNGLLAMLSKVQRVQSAFGVDYQPAIDRYARSFTAVNSNFRTLKSTLINDLEKSATGYVNTLRILPGRYTLTGSQQKIPVTIVNGFDQPVTLSVQIEPHAPRIIARGTTSIEIPANGRTQLQVPVESVATGRVAADAFLITSDGQRYGDGAVLNLDVRNIGPVAHWILYGSAALLALAVSLRLTRRIRTKKAS